MVQTVEGGTPTQHGALPSTSYTTWLSNKEFIALGDIPLGTTHTLRLCRPGTHG